MYASAHRDPDLPKLPKPTPLPRPGKEPEPAAEPSPASKYLALADVPAVSHPAELRDWLNT